MEVLEPNPETLTTIQPDWDEWLVFDNCPRIVERGIDFSSDISTIKRYLFVEASRRGYDVTVKILQGDRLIFQIFHPANAYPKLPEGSDARKKHPWSLWLDGNLHDITIDLNQRASLRAYIYKQAKARGLKAFVKFTETGLTVHAYKDTE
jgi:hypothetical protein